MYPYGYAGARISLEQMLAKTTVARLHPEFRRRLVAMLQEAQRIGVDLGVGTGWRTQPNPPPPGFAKPGNSNHEGFPADRIPQTPEAGAVAADMVNPSAWDWMDRNARRFGLRTFKRGGVSNPGYTGINEPWHVQPAEIPNSRSYRRDPWKLDRFPLPGAPQPAPAPPAPSTPSEVITVDAKVQVLRPNANAQRGYDVFVLQSILNGIYAAGLQLDGIYGIKSIAAVQDAQRKLELEVDGIVGPQTWGRLLNG